MKEIRTMSLAELREFVKTDPWGKMRVDSRWLLALVEERNRLRGTPEANLDVDLESSASSADQCLSRIRLIAQGASAKEPSARLFARLLAISLEADGVTSESRDFV